MANQLDFKALAPQLEKMVQQEGYRQTERDKEKSSKNSKRYSKGGDKILLSDLRKDGRFYYYQNTEDGMGDYGDAVSFVKNRLYGSVSVLKGTTKEQYALLAERFSTSAIIVPMEPEYIRTEKVKFNISKFQVDEIGANDFPILKFRGLGSIETQDKEFANSFRKLTNPNTGNSNILFLWTKNNNEIGGGQFKYWDYESKKYIKRFLANTDRDNSLWRTELEGREAIFITEDPIDALSHQKLFPEEDFGYVCPGGSITNSQLKLIQELQLDHNVPIILGMDNDEAGFKMNKKVAEYLLGATIPVNDNTELTTYLESKKAFIDVQEPEYKDWNEQLIETKKNEKKKGNSIKM